MDYFIVDINSAQQLDLTGSELLVYSALAYLTKRKAWKGSSYQLAKYSRCGSANTAKRAADRLIERGLIVQDSNGYIVLQNDAVKLQNDAKLLQNDANLKESSKENINKNKSSLSVSKDTSNADGRTDFDIFWANFAPTGALRKKKSACRSFFFSNNMCDDWRRLAVERAAEHEPDRDPYWYLHDYDFLNNGCVMNAEPVSNKPDWLSGEEQTNCLQAHIPLAVCWNPDAQKYGVVTLDQAEKLGLQIKNKLT